MIDPSVKGKKHESLNHGIITIIAQRELGGHKIPSN